MARVLTKDAAAALARPGFTEFQARGLLHRWAAQGILPQLGKEGRSAKSSWAFDRETVQIAAVMRELHQADVIQDAAQLRALYQVFATPRADDQPPLIDLVLADIEREGEPVLCVTFWNHFTGAWVTSFAVRLGDEYDVPIMSPGDGWEPAFDGVLKLAPILARFIDNADNVVPLRKADA